VPSLFAIDRVSALALKKSGSAAKGCRKYFVSTRCKLRAPLVFLIGRTRNDERFEAFSARAEGATELNSESVELEKSLQTLIEKNMVSMFGVRLLASEYMTGKTHGGRIESLGLDENSCPVIIEYKRAINENVINQGLFYLDLRS
jgi:hypothetical protein